MLMQNGWSTMKISVTEMVRWRFLFWLVYTTDAVPANVSHYSHSGVNNSQFHGPDNLRATSPHPVATVAEPAAAHVLASPIAPQADQSAAQQPVSSSI